MANISVAIAVYNGEKFIREQLDSILCQLCDGDEIVASYDTSTDSSLEILTAYAERDSRVKVVKNEVAGIATNFNNALKNCKGDYIFICDQDDRWAENKRESVVKSFEKSGADMVIHNGVHIDGEGKVISKPFFEMYRIGDGKLRNLIKPRYSGCCTAFTKEMADRILPIPADIDAYDHWVGTVGEFTGKIFYNDDILLYHRLHGDNMTPTSTRSVSVILKARWGLLKHLSRRLKEIRGKSR